MSGIFNASVLLFSVLELKIHFGEFVCTLQILRQAGYLIYMKMVDELDYMAFFKSNFKIYIISKICEL